jgi:hypothetical protein
MHPRRTFAGFPREVLNRRRPIAWLIAIGRQAKFSSGEIMQTRARKLLSAALVTGALALAGCASVPLAPAAQDQAGKTFAAPSGQARIYLYRNETFGAAIKMPVTFNGASVGQTASKTYFYWDVPAGKHTIASLTENSPTVEVNAKPNGVYYVWQEVKMGAFAARSALHVVEEDQGKKGVEQCKLAEVQKY